MKRILRVFLQIVLAALPLGEACAAPGDVRAAFGERPDARSRVARPTAVSALNDRNAARNGAHNAARDARNGYPWGAQAFTYFATRTPLRVLFNDFGTQYQVPVSVDTRVHGLADGQLSASTPSAFLDDMGQAHRLDWFYANGRLYISRRLDRVARPIDLAGRSADEAERVLAGMGVFNPHFGFVSMQHEGRVMVSGPPAYVDLIARSLASLTPLASSEERDPTRFGFFTLRHARVYDRTYKFRGNTIVVPGVHKMIGELLGVSVSGTGGTGGIGGMTGIGGTGSAMADTGRDADRDPDHTTATMRTQRYSRLRAPSAPQVDGRVTEGSVRISSVDATDEREGRYVHRERTRRPGGWLEAPSAQAVSVVADRRLNALIVRGPPDIIEASRALIERLDVPVPLIQLEAVIIDLKESALDELGVDWRINTRNVQFSSQSRNALSEPMMTVLPDSGRVLVQLRALEESGQAHIVSRPSILTQDNTAALLDLSESFFVRNRGRDFADTTQVDVGLMMNIIPGVVDPEAALPRVMLDIQIEDGEISALKDDNIPRTRRNVIATQASVRSTESLLIAGHHKQVGVEGSNGIPGLSKIPILGALFRTDNAHQETVKRYFLITPRVLAFDHADLRDSPSSLAVTPGLRAAMAGDGVLALHAETLRQPIPQQPILPPERQPSHQPEEPLAHDAMSATTQQAEQPAQRAMQLTPTQPMAQPIPQPQPTPTPMQQAPAPRAPPADISIWTRERP